MERIRNRPLEILLGLLLTVGVVTAVTLVWLSFRGALGDYYTVDAHLGRASDALEQGDPVSFRNVIVGEVTATSGALDGSAVARLQLHADQARLIPAGVTAVALPRTLFGAVQIELLPPARPDSARLHDGASIAPATGPQAESLQSALANAYRLLTSIHPAQLDAALSALASALDGQGERLGRLVTSADRYLRAIAPHMGELTTVITDFASVTDGLARSAPDLLGSLRNLLVVTRGLTQQKQAVAQLLAVAPTAVDDAQLLLNPRTVDDIVTVFRAQASVAGVLAERPRAVVDTIAGFRAFGQAFASAASSGPYLRANILLTGVDVAELFPIVSGAQGHAFDGIDDPPVYTAADCPRYGAQAGPNCGTAAPASAHARVLSTGNGYGGTVDSVGSPPELAAVRAAAAALTHLPAGSVPDAADLLLGPLLRGSATVISP